MLRPRQHLRNLNIAHRRGRTPYTVAMYNPHRGSAAGRAIRYNRAVIAKVPD